MFISITVSICAVVILWSASKRGYIFFPSKLIRGPNNRIIFFQLPVIVFIASIVSIIFLRLTYNWIKPFSPDEIEHLHTAWLISTGLIPYQDFFQHHPPFFWWVLAIPLKFFKTISVFTYAGAIKIIINFLTISIFILLAFISKEIYENWLSGITTFVIVILSGWGRLSEGLFEIRPDILMFFFFFLGFLFLVKFLKKPSNKSYFYYGLFFAIFSQFVLPKLPFSLCFLVGYSCNAMVKQNGFCTGARHVFLSFILSIGFFLLFHGTQINLIDMFNFVFRVNMNIDTYLENRFSMALAERYILIIFFSGSGFFLAITNLKKGIFDPFKLVLFVLTGSFIELFLFFSHLIPHYYFGIYLMLSILCGGVTLHNHFDYRFLDILLLIIGLFLAFNFPQYNQSVLNKKAQAESIQYLLDNTKQNDYVFLNTTLHPVFRFDSSYYWFSRHRVLPYLSGNIKNLDFLPFKEELFDVRVALNKKRPVFINSADSFCWGWADSKYLTSMDQNTITTIPMSYPSHISTQSWPFDIAKYSPPLSPKEHKGD